MSIKRILALVLALLMVLTLSACSVAEELAYAALDEISQNLDEMAETPTEDHTQDVVIPDPTAPPAEEPAEVVPEAPAEEIPAEEEPAEEAVEEPALPALDEDGTYTTKEDVALYIHTYGKLPQNFITKKEAEALGWPGGELEPYAPGKCIGGSRFGNYEGLLPDAPARTWTECDIDTLGAKKRGAKRIVYSNDGLIYYTGDHYESFELLYGEE